MFLNLISCLLMSFNSGIVFWLVVSLVIKVFKVKNPIYRQGLMGIPLIKSALSLISYSQPTKLLPLRGGWFFSFRLTIFPVATPLNKLLNQSGAIRIEMGVLLVVIVIAISNYLYQLRKIKIALKLGKPIMPKLAARLSRVCQQMKVSMPKVVIIETPFAPFTLGICSPTIVISPWMINNLTSQELEAVFAHELAHIKNLDNFWQMQLYLIGKILFFHPLKNKLVNLISIEKEVACDQMVSRTNFDWLAGLKKGLISISLRQHLKLKEEDLILPKTKGGGLPYSSSIINTNRQTCEGRSLVQGKENIHLQAKLPLSNSLVEVNHRLAIKHPTNQENKWYIDLLMFSLFIWLIIFQVHLGVIVKGVPISFI